MKIQILLVPYDSGQHGVRMGRGPGFFLRNGAGSRLRAPGHRVDAEFIVPESGEYVLVDHEMKDAYRGAVGKIIAPRDAAGTPGTTR